MITEQRIMDSINDSLNELADDYTRLKDDTIAIRQETIEACRSIILGDLKHNILHRVKTLAEYSNNNMQWDLKQMLESAIDDIDNNKQAFGPDSKGILVVWNEGDGVRSSGWRMARTEVREAIGAMKVAELTLIKELGYL